MSDFPKVTCAGLRGAAIEGRRQLREHRCPVCLKGFLEHRDLLTHMKRKRHSIDGTKSFVRNSPEHKLAEYHRDKTGQDVKLYQFGNKP